jgi:hypothetical protein
MYEFPVCESCINLNLKYSNIVLLNGVGWLKVADTIDPSLVSAG